MTGIAGEVADGLLCTARVPAAFSLATDGSAPALVAIEAAAQALELYAAGAQRVELGTPHGLDEAAGVRLLGEVVLPLLRRHGIGAQP